MSEKIIELLRIKGMGGFSSTVLHYNTFFIVLAVIVSIFICLSAVCADDQVFLNCIIILILAVNFYFWCAFMPTSADDSLKNVSDISEKKIIKISEINKHYIVDSQGVKYNIDLITNWNTSIGTKRDALKKQVNNKPTEFKIYRYKNENIVIDYSPQKGTIDK